MKVKKRLDQWVVDQHPEISKTLAQSLIMQGKVKVDDVVVTKPGTQIKEEAVIAVDLEKPKFVSRAGFKLEGALDQFDIDVTDYVVMDAGLSTGGFTDCLLQHGARKVYGVDVGYGQVHEKIRADDRVVVMERTNLRNLESLPELVDLVTLDLSFISVLKVIEVVHKILKPNGRLIVLIKPQFEARRDQIGKGGIIKDSQVHEEVIEKVKKGISEAGFKCLGITESPIKGTEGNKEFLAYFQKKELV